MLDCKTGWDDNAAGIVLELITSKQVTLGVSCSNAVSVMALLQQGAPS